MCNNSELHNTDEWNPSAPFKVKRRIRQGDPLSPYLFILSIKYLTRSLKTLRVTEEFIFHPRCQKLHIVQLNFVDDLLLFCRGDLTQLSYYMIVFWTSQGYQA